jgi:hypothetical protein
MCMTTETGHILTDPGIHDWNQALSQVAHFEGESDSGLESERRASNLLHVGETQSYP